MNGSVCIWSVEVVVVLVFYWLNDSLTLETGLKLQIFRMLEIGEILGLGMLLRT